MDIFAKAYAQTAASGVPMGATAPSATEAFMLNVVLILVLVVLFYFLLIKPQQKRIQKHREMVDTMKKGDKVVTSGGLIGKIHKIDDKSDEATVELAKDVIVKVVRSTLQPRDEGATK